MTAKRVKVLTDLTYCGSAFKAGEELAMGGREAGRLAAVGAVEVVGDVAEKQAGNPRDKQMRPAADK